MRICTKCHIEKEDTEFFKAKKGKCGLSSICKACDTQRTTERYHKNRKDWFELLSRFVKLECCVCGYNKFFSVLEFHHEDPKQKEFKISDAFNRKCSGTRIIMVLDEVSKCKVMCANCHAEDHAVARGEKILAQRIQK